jgi:hypothetical protein
MATITTGTHPKALWPGIKAWWGRSYSEHPTEYLDLFDKQTSDKAYEEEVEITGFGLAPVKPQGAQTFYDIEAQGSISRYTHVAYALGYIVTKEELADNLYEKVSKSRARSLAFSMRQTKEAYFVRTNIPNGLTYFERDSISFDQDNDFDTRNAKAACYERYSGFWADWRALYGNQGV